MSAHSTYDRPGAFILSTIGFVFAPMAVIAPQGVWIPALAGAIALGVLRWRHAGARLRPKIAWLGLPALLALAFVVWGALGSLWSIDPDRSLKAAARLLLVTCSLAILLDAARGLDDEERLQTARWVFRGVLTGLGLIAMLTVIAGLGGDRGPAIPTVESVSHLSQPTALIAVLAWPAAAIAGRKSGPWAAIAMIVAAALVCLILPPRSAFLALGVGVLVFMTTWRFPASVGPLLMLMLVGSAALIPLMPLLAPSAIELLIEAVDWPASQVHRIAVWEFSANLILERPITGWGLDTSRLVPGGDLRIELFETASGQPHTGEAMPLHPHNALVQIWLETGLTGLSLSIVALVLTLRRCTGRSIAASRPVRAALAASAASAFTLAQLSFGIWQGWWIASLGITAVLGTAIFHVGAPTVIGRNGKRGSSLHGGSAASSTIR